MRYLAGRTNVHPETRMIDNPQFDRYAEEYEAQLARSLSPTGEDKNYYARGRMLWVLPQLRRLGVAPRRALDYGCGTGTAAPHLLKELGAERVVGVDVSPRSLEVARREHAGAGARFCLISEYEPAGEFDFAYTSGVFHHIPAGERGASVAYLSRALRRGGVLAFWENNPWNPGTRYTMSLNEFDRDAEMLSPPAARRLLSAGGFEILRADSLFYFPRPLAFLRWTEPYLARLPLGGLYLLLCRMP
jgi:SAM-dependent methyltransferase